ncbi:ATP-binding protein [Uliginosibacterium sp. 31-16]|uniref:ATP-binding protein n=1 Tax=Uliginosibacterium sp. 31-16 TaxID=3068315 RepID=UPI00273D4878|nr:ATP-binding protein [Uliginosibacterium sp. 31-16]MDP5240633.1 ATP-binding protein [Uliginosibacterium sp. 31-16]
MFHIRDIELVHWDFWRRFTLPLDAQIITIVGPNGSGKTTLLDAMRTLFALKCSGKRDFRRYVRRANAGFAWIRTTVSNKPGSTGKRPFFPCLKDEVTLACRIKRAGGDWTREYCIEDGLVTVEQLEETAQFVGLRDYQSRLAYAGLTPAIAKVLSLEQGDTDKLCEYSPRALLDLVFDVFGDKEVLDNYQAAREEQKTAQRELEALALDLEKLKAQAEGKRMEAERFLEWRELYKEATDLEAEAIPRLEVAELQTEIDSWRGKLRRARLDVYEAEHTLNNSDARMASLAGEKAQAEAGLSEASARQKELDAQWLTARDALRDIDKKLAERDALRERVAKEHGEAALDSEDAAANAYNDWQAARTKVRELTQRFEEVSTRLREAQGKGATPQDHEVQRFRSALNDAGIEHKLLAEITEITDPAWQGALEAILRPYRSLILLENDGDRHEAWALGERERFRHFVVADRAPCPDALPGSLLEVVRFAGEPPKWLAELLNRIRRVDNAQAAGKLPRDQDWITREGYHRERRGARHLGVPHDFWFGELARTARLEGLQQEISELDKQLNWARKKQDEHEAAMKTAREKLLGMQAAELMLARAAEFEAATQDKPALQDAFKRAEADLTAARAEVDRCKERLAGIAIEADRRARDLAQAREVLKRVAGETRPQRLEQTARLLRLRGKRRGMPKHWLEADALNELAEHYGGLAGARNELTRLKRRLHDGDWPQDEAVLIVKEKLSLELTQREGDYGQRMAYSERTKTMVDEARAAYIARLRATVRQYGKNLRALGDLSGVGVECPVPVLENDDATLAAAGLEVAFDFDQKGAQSLNDGEASGGQQVMKSLILLIALLMDDARPGGFVFIDEPFAHLDVANIDRVGAFLRATRAQYLITTPVTHNANVFQPAQLTLITRKKKPADSWAPPIGVLRRQID